MEADTTDYPYQAGAVNTPQGNPWVIYRFSWVIKFFFCTPQTLSLTIEHSRSDVSIAPSRGTFSISLSGFEIPQFDPGMNGWAEAMALQMAIICRDKLICTGGAMSDQSLISVNTLSEIPYRTGYVGLARETVRLVLLMFARTSMALLWWCLLMARPCMVAMDRRKNKRNPFSHAFVHRWPRVEGLGGGHRTQWYVTKCCR